MSATVAESENRVPSKAEADLARSVALTREIASTRKKVVTLIAQRDALWKKLNSVGGVTQQRIAEACGMTTDAVYQGIRRAVGRPVKRGGEDPA